MNAPDTGDQSQTTPRKQISILVVQLGDADEVFRSLMALKAIKHLYPESVIDFISRKETSAPVKRVEWLRSCSEIPGNEEAGHAAIQKVALWIDQVIDHNYDFLVNWTFAPKYRRMSALASTLIPAVVKFGEFVRDDLSIASADAWSIYRESWIRNQIEQDIHCTDMITTQLLTGLQIHSGDPSPDAGASAVSSKYFFKTLTEPAFPDSWIHRPKNLKWVALNVDTLEERAGELVEIMLRRHPDAGIVLLGKQTSIDVDSSRVVNLCDEHVSGMNFDVIIRVLTNCQFLISGKSALVDLASLMNVRIVYSINGIVDPQSLMWAESGPYGNGHFVVSSINEWKPELLYAVWSFAQSEWFHKGTINIKAHFANLGMSELWESSIQEGGIYRSRIRPATEGGGVSYENQNGLPPNFESWMVRVRGQIARSWFCGWLPSVEAEVSRMQLHPDLIKRVRKVQESLNALQKLSLEGKSLSVELKATSEEIKNAYLMKIEDREKIEDYGRKLLEVEALISRVVHVEPELRCMLLWYQHLMHNLKGSTISDMAKETAHAFDLVTEGLELIGTYCEKTLALAKPRAVAAEKTIPRIAPRP